MTERRSGDIFCDATPPHHRLLWGMSLALAGVMLASVGLLSVWPEAFLMP